MKNEQNKFIEFIRKDKVVIALICAAILVVIASVALGVSVGSRIRTTEPTDPANPSDVTTESVTEKFTESEETTVHEETEPSETTEGVIGTAENPVLNDIDLKNIESFTLGNHEIVLPCTLKELIGEEKASQYEDKLDELIEGKRDSQYYDLTVMVDEALHKAVCTLKIAEGDGPNMSRVYINAIQSSEPVISICGITVGNTLNELVDAMEDNPHYSPVGKEESPIAIYRTVHYRASFYLGEKSDVITQIRIEYIGDDNSTIVVE